MSTAEVVVLIVVIVVVIAVAALAWSAYRRRSLRQRFGPEYDAAIDAANSRRAGEGELRERERRHQELDIQPLSTESREEYAAQWAQIQEQFVDDPTAAVADADAVVTELIAERGYPTDGFDQQLADLSVEHAQTLNHYRAAHDISLDSANAAATTEDLRQALVHYRALFADLLGDGTALLGGDGTTLSGDGTSASPDHVVNPTTTAASG